MSKARKFEDITTTGIFLAVVFGLCVFSLYAFTKPADQMLTQEHRLPTPLPKVRPNLQSIRRATTAFDKCFIDRLALRTELVAGRNLLIAKTFMVSPSTAVLIGKNDWLYYMGDGDKETLRHSHLFNEETLLAWKNALEEQNDWLAARGIKYAFVLAPSKCTIYPEYVPPQYTQINTQSRADQLVAYLRKNTSIDVIDLRQPLIEKKSEGQLYLKTDTHWNKFGAMLASNIVIHHLLSSFPNIKEGLASKEYSVTTKLIEHGDLAGLMGLDGFISENGPLLSRAGGEGWKLSHNPPMPRMGDPRDIYKPLATMCVPIDTTLPKVLLFGDSFSVPLVAYLAPHFNRIYLDRDFKDRPEGRFVIDTVEKEKPDIVIQELTERKLMLPPPKNPRELCERLSQSKPSSIY
jgi:alginate O-acetyltransferase complex protein AlgJ